MAARYKRCVLHIGTEKTGSTTLQAFLALNRGALAARGIYVPASLSPYDTVANHERLTTYALNGGKLDDDLRRAAGVHTAEQVEQHRAQVVAALEAELAGAPGPREMLLLSNEHCHSRLVGLDEVLRLKDLVQRFAEHVSILVYIRPQHELAASLYDQALRAGYYDIGVLPDFAPEAEQWVTRQYFDYADLTARWARAFSPQGMTVRIFSREELHQGDVVADALQQIGCSAEGLGQPEKQNTSVGADYQPVLNAINRAVARGGVPLEAEVRDRIAERLRRMSKRPGRQPSREEARRFLASFEDSNELVRLIYFPDRAQLFTPDFSRLPEVAAPPRPEVDLMAETIVQLVASHG